MTTNMLAYLACAIISVEHPGDNPYIGHGDNGQSHGYAQGKTIMLAEIQRTTGTRYHPHVWYSREGSINAICDYYRGWRRKIGGRWYTVADLTPGQAAILWGAGPGGLDKRLQSKPGPYAAAVQNAYDESVQRMVSR